MCQRFPIDFPKSDSGSGKPYPRRMLRRRVVNSAVAVLAVFLATILLATPDDPSMTTLGRSGIAQGMLPDCPGCDRGSVATSCQAACASIAVAPAATATVLPPARKARWITLPEADRSGLRPIPEPRPPQLHALA
jgi:hypothetical protein